MGRSLWLLTLILAAPALLAAQRPDFGQSGDAVTLAYYEALTELELSAADGAVRTEPLRGQPVSMEFDAFGRRFALTLSPNASLLPATLRAALSERGIGVYQGTIRGVEGSWARVVIQQGMPRGMIFDGTEVFSLEAPPDSMVQGASHPVIYRLADLVIEPGQLGCGTARVDTSGAAALESLVGELKTLAAALGPGATQNLNLGAVADFEFSENFGSAAEAALLDRFNRVDGIFSTELGVQLTVTEIDIFTTDDDPFTASDPGQLLNQLASYRSTTPAQRAQGLSHLYTGRDLDGTTVGIAFVGALCSSFAGAGLSEGRRLPLTDSLIAAHEIGHNFGAGHDGDPPCEDTPPTFLMAPSINGSSEFSQCSKDQIALEMAGAICLTPVADVDVTASIDNAALTVLTGSDFSYGVTLDNQGSQEASDVTATIQVPSEITIQAASPSAGSCSVGAGAANCSLGAIPGNSTRTIELTLRATAPGELEVDVSVTAGNDSDPANNQARGAITANPAVDLALEPVGATSVNVNGTLDLAVSLSNNAGVTANDVSVSFALDAGLRAAAASYDLGSCTVAAQQVDCVGGTLGAGARADLTLSLTGITAGSHSVSITASASEAELDDSDNSMTAAIDVRNAVSTPTAGGGGAVFWSLLLAVPWALRRGSRLAGGGPLRPANRQRHRAVPRLRRGHPERMPSA